MANEEATTIYCVGEEGALGHPKVYLEFNAEGKAVCPYCDKIFTQAHEQFTSNS